MASAQTAAIGGQSGAVASKHSALVGLAPSVSAADDGRRGAVHPSPEEGCPRRVARMDHGAEGSGDTFAVGQARWTARPPVVEESSTALVPGQPAHGRSDLADRWGEALWESLVGAVP